MSPENTAALYAVAPRLYRDKPVIECGDGWFSLLRNLSQRLETMALPVIATQVKEKFGMLRFYISCGNPDIFHAINQAEEASACICETCGSPGKLHSPNGIFYTACDEHA